MASHPAKLRGRELVRKKAHAYRTIGEAAEAIGVPAHVLRFWETKFSQIRPMKKGGGRRYFRPEDISLLHGIKVFLYEKEYAIKELQEFLRKEGMGPVIAAGAAGDKPEPVKVRAAETPPKVKPESMPAPEPEPEPEPETEPVAVETADPMPVDAEDEDAPVQGTLFDALSRLQGARDKLNQTLKKG